MSEYLAVKWLHVLSSAVLFGTGVGSAFYLLRACLSREPALVHFVARQVVVADWIFTATAMVVQPLTGFRLAHLAGFPLATPWILYSTVLYVVAGACWLPVVVIQLRMRDMALAAQPGGELPERFWRYFRWWVALGIPAMFSLLAVFWLMIAKPA